MKLGLFDTFLRETKNMAKKDGGLPRELLFVKVDDYWDY